MKKSLLVCIFGLMASSVFAGYEIKVCFIPLKEIVDDTVKSYLSAVESKHVFMKGHDGTGLNFEPVNPMEIFGGQARIGKQNYENAECEAVFSTEDKAEYEQKWNAVVERYEAAARTHKYSLDGKNCLGVSYEVLTQQNLRVPEELNRQIGMLKLMSSVLSLARVAIEQYQQGNCSIQ